MLASNSPRACHNRRQFLQGLFYLGGASVLTGCGATITSAASSAALPQVAAGTQPIPTGSVLQGSIALAQATGASIQPGFVGLSYEKSMLCKQLFRGTNEGLIRILQLLGPGTVRIGGNSVDQCVWNPQGTGRTSGQISPPDVDNLAAFLKQAGWKCIYGINLGGAATGATSPALAAAEVSYVARQLESLLGGIEIGNECEAYGAQGSYFSGNWSLPQFESLWMTFRDAIVSSNPDLAIVGPASGTSVSNWTIPFQQFAAPQGLSLVTQHYYRGDGHSSAATIGNLLSPDTNLSKCLALLNSAGMPFRLGECNSYYNGGAVGVSNSYASSLWVLDFLFNSAQGGAAGVNLHGGGNAAGYTPIADDSANITELRPEFYGMLLFSLAGQGKLLQTQMSAGQANISAYAIARPDGGTNLVVINKELVQNLNLSIELARSASSATLSILSQRSSNAGAPDLAATAGVTIQGATVDATGSFTPGPPYSLTRSNSGLSCYVPASTAVLVQISAA